MESRIPPGSYFQYAPPGIHGSLQRSGSLTDRERYLADLLAEKQKLGPFMQILPVCNRLLNQEIMRISGLLSNHVAELERMGHDHPYRSMGQQPNGGQMNMAAWNAMQTDQEDKLLQKMAPFQPFSLNRHVVPGTPTAPVVKRVVRLDVPIEKYPNYNFVGRILGPRGNSLKRVEAMTDCRIYIRGQGSVKDTLKEEKLKDKPGYEHLNEPLHILLEAEFPEDIMDARLEHAISILENLLKPVCTKLPPCFKTTHTFPVTVLLMSTSQSPHSYCILHMVKEVSVKSFAFREVKGVAHVITSWSSKGECLKIEA